MSNRPHTFGPAPDTLLPSEVNDVQDDYGLIRSQREVLAYANTAHLAGSQPVLADHLVDGTPGVQYAVASGVVESASLNAMFSTNYDIWVNDQSPKTVMLGLTVGYLRTATSPAIATTVSVVTLELNSFVANNAAPPFMGDPPNYDVVPLDDPLTVSVAAGTVSGTVLESSVVFPFEDFGEGEDGESIPIPLAVRVQQTGSPPASTFENIGILVTMWAV